MKKNFMRLAAFAAAAAFTLASCAVEPLDTPASDDSALSEATLDDDSASGDFTVTFNCTIEDVEDPVATRTEFHDNTIWWSVGDQALFAQYAVVDGTPVYKSTQNTPLTSSKEVLSLTVKSFNKPDEGTDAAYFSVYPYASYAARTTSSDIIYPRITLPSTQSPSTDSFDPDADLLISEYVTNLEPGDDGKYSIKLKYKRMVAIAKMTIKNLPSSDEIVSVDFSAIKSGKAADLAGSRYYDLVNGTPSTLSSSSCFSESKISLDYSGQNIVANSSTGMTAYFMCYPLELASGDSFKVVVTTEAGEVFTREVTIPADRSLILEAGRGTKFSVDMSTAEKTYPWLTISDENPSDFTEGSHKIMAYGFGCSTGTVTSMSYKLVLASDYLSAVGEGTVDELYASGMTTITESSIANVNNGKMIYYTKPADGVVVPDADYYILVKLTDSSKGEIKAAGVVHSEPFAFLTTNDVPSWTSGVFGHKFYGANIQSIQYLVVESSVIEGGLNNTNCKKYFDNHKSEASSITSSTISSINSNGAAGYGYLKISKTFTAGAECVELVLATMTDGSTKFCWKKQNAKS